MLLYPLSRLALKRPCSSLLEYICTRTFVLWFCGMKRGSLTSGPLWCEFSSCSERSQLLDFFTMHAQKKKSWAECAADTHGQRVQMSFPLQWQRLSGPPIMLHHVACHKPHDLRSQSHISEVERKVGSRCRLQMVPARFSIHRLSHTTCRFELCVEGGTWQRLVKWSRRT